MDENDARSEALSLIHRMAEFRCETNIRSSLGDFVESENRNISLKAYSDRREDALGAMIMLERIISCNGLRNDLFEFFNGKVMRISFRNLEHRRARTPSEWNKRLRAYIRDIANSNAYVKQMHYHFLRSPVGP